MIKLLYLLYKIKFLTPKGIFALIQSIYKYKVTLITLLHFSSKLHKNKIAVIEENNKITYEDLFHESIKLSNILYTKYKLTPNSKVAFLCANSIPLIKSIFAIAPTGSDIYLLNTEMSLNNFNSLVDSINFDLLIYDYEMSELIKESNYKNNSLLSLHKTKDSINTLLSNNSELKYHLQVNSSSKLIILTSGTTGKSKSIPYRPSLFKFLNPLFALMHRLNLAAYKSVYISTPLYHGYGLAILFLFMTLGKKIAIINKFTPQIASSIIKKNKIEILIAVPLIINKLIDFNTQNLLSLKCIVTGGVKLNTNLVNLVFKKLGNILYNIYGTSETGLLTISTPKDLKYNNLTIGKKILGTKIKIVDSNKNELTHGQIGQFQIKTTWSMIGLSNWIIIGDLGYKDKNGYYFLSGRTDDMIISAGENVYPIELESILNEHPYIEDVVVFGINDEAFGQRLKAYVQLSKGKNLTFNELIKWLKPKVARYHIPKEIEFVNEIPYNALGKLNKNTLLRNI